MDIGIDYFLAGLIGFTVGMAELVARYRDDPLRAVGTAPAVFYAVVNVGAALVALWLLENVWQVFQTDADKDVVARTKQVLTAGFGAIALFRSSIFTLRVGENDIAVGPSLLLDILLAAADRAVDRSMAAPRAKIVGDIMESVSFEKSKISLPTHCFALMQNISADEQQQFALQIDALSNAGMSDRAKALNLGLALLNLVGDEVLRTARENLGDEISAD